MSLSAEVGAAAPPRELSEASGSDARKLLRRALLSETWVFRPVEMEIVRAAGPCLEVWPGTFAVSRMSSCRSVLMDTRFVVDERDIFARRFPEWRTSSAARSFLRELLSFNGDDHHRLREVMIADFLPPANRRMHALVTRTVAEHLDDGLAALASGAPLDLDVVCSRIPLLTVGRFLGVPDSSADFMASRIPTFSALIEASFTSARLKAAADQAVDEMGAHLRPLIAAKEAEPDDGFISTLLAARGQLPELLDEDGLLSNVLLIYSAGYETTRSLLRSALRVLVTDRPIAEAVRSRPDGVVALLREIERLHPAIPLTVRYAREATEVDGVQIPAGSQVYVMINAANRDPETYPGEDVDELRLDRRPSRSLAFGGGVRACLGVLMARAISELTVKTVAAALPGLDVVVATGTPGLRVELRTEGVG